MGRLLGRGLADQLAAAGVERKLTRAEEEVAGPDRLAVGADRRRRAGGLDRLSLDIGLLSSWIALLDLIALARQRLDDLRAWSAPRVSITSSTPVSAMCRWTPSRRWRTSTTLAPAAATRSSSCARPPGRSEIRVKRTAPRPCRASLRRATATSSSSSMLPPESTTAVLPSAAGSTLPPINAASPTAPAPSTTSLASASSAAIASPTSSSETTTTRSTQRSTSARVSSPGRFTAIPSATVRAAVTRLGATGGERAWIGSAGVDLDPDHLDLGSGRLDRDRDAADQPAAAQRNHDRAQVVDVLEQLQADASLSGDDVGVVEGVHEDGSLALGEPQRGLDAIVDGSLAGMDRGPEAGRRLDLGDGGVGRHEEIAAGALALRGERNRLTVVAGAAGDDSPLDRAFAAAQLGAGAAQLEGAALLQALRLQRQPAAAAGVDRRHPQGRRAGDQARDPIARPLDPIDPDLVLAAHAVRPGYRRIEARRERR